MDLPAVTEAFRVSAVIDAAFGGGALDQGSTAT